jgi:excisionase family DNA binding protein
MAKQAGQTSATDYYTVPEIMAMLDVSNVTVIRLIQRGEFPGAYRTSWRGPYRVPRQSVIDYIKRMQVS